MIKSDYNYSNLNYTSLKHICNNTCLSKIKSFLFLIWLLFLSFLQWQKRFFVLHANKKLHYYKNEKEKRPVKDPINLALCKSVESHLDHYKFDNVFSVVTEHRTYYLVAGSRQDMENWVEKLCHVCGFRRTDDNRSQGKLMQIYTLYS